MYYLARAILFYTGGLVQMFFSVPITGFDPIVNLLTTHPLCDNRPPVAELDKNCDSHPGIPNGRPQVWKKKGSEIADCY